MGMRSDVVTLAEAAKAMSSPQVVKSADSITGAISGAHNFMGTVRPALSDAKAIVSDLKEMGAWDPCIRILAGLLKIPDVDKPLNPQAIVPQNDRKKAVIQAINGAGDADLEEFVQYYQRFIQAKAQAALQAQAAAGGAAGPGQAVEGQKDVS